MANEQDGIARDKDGIPTSIRIFRVGKNPDVRGFSAVYEPKDARAILKANNRADGKVPIDVAHGMVEPTAPPESHEAVGWATLRCDRTGIWLDDIEWSPAFRKKLLDRRFRYYSPTFLVDKRELRTSKGKSARIVEVMTLSVTNVPATSDIRPIVEGLVLRSMFIEASGGSSPLLTDMATAKTNADELERKKRESDDEDEDDKDADDGDTGHDEPDGDEGDGETEKRDDEEEEEADLNVADLDVDSMDEAEAKKALTKVCNMYMDLVAKQKKDDEESEEEEEEEKRGIARSLIQDRLANLEDRKRLLSLSLKELRAAERKLRSQGTKSRDDAATRKRLSRADTSTRYHDDNAFQRRVNDAVMGPTVTDDDVVRHAQTIDPDAARRLGLLERDPGRQWGNVPTFKTNEKRN